MAHTAEKAFIPLDIAVLTLSDTRTADNDTSGRPAGRTAAAGGPSAGGPGDRHR